MGSCHPTTWPEATVASATQHSIYFFFVCVIPCLLEAKRWLYTLGLNLFSKCSFCSSLASKIVDTHLSRIRSGGGSLSRKEHLPSESSKRRKCQMMASFMYKGRHRWNFRDVISFFAVNSFDKALFTFSEDRGLLLSVAGSVHFIILPTASSGPGMVWLTPGEAVSPTCIIQ